MKPAKIPGAAAGDEDRLRREFRDKTGVPIGDRPALCQISGISRDSL